MKKTLLLYYSPAPAVVQSCLSIFISLFSPRSHHILMWRWRKCVPFVELCFRSMEVKATESKVSNVINKFPLFVEMRMRMIPWFDWTQNFFPSSSSFALFFLWRNRISIHERSIYASFASVCVWVWVVNANGIMVDLKFLSFYRFIVSGGELGPKFPILRSSVRLCL